MRHPRRAVLARHGGDVDDTGLGPLPQRRERRLAAEEDAAHVDRHGEVPGLLAQVLHRRDVDHAGVADQDVETAELLDRLVDHRLHLRPLRDVGPDRLGSPAGSADLVRGPLGGFVAAQRRIPVLLRVARHPVDLADGDVGPLPRQRESDPAPDAAPAAGHQRHFPCREIMRRTVGRAPPNLKQRDAGSEFDQDSFRLPVAASVMTTRARRYSARGK